MLPEHAWEIRSTGDGAHGLRESAWSLVPLPEKSGDGFEDARPRPGAGTSPWPWPQPPT
nr:hypothetical protein [Streptomyces spinoverrucosus]